MCRCTMEINYTSNGIAANTKQQRTNIHNISLINSFLMQTPSPPLFAVDNEHIRTGIMITNSGLYQMSIRLPSHLRLVRINTWARQSKRVPGFLMTMIWLKMSGLQQCICSYFSSLMTITHVIFMDLQWHRPWSGLKQISKECHLSQCSIPGRGGGNGWCGITGSSPLSSLSSHTNTWCRVTSAGIQPGPGKHGHWAHV